MGPPRVVSQGAHWAAYYALQKPLHQAVETLSDGNRSRFRNAALSGISEAQDLVSIAVQELVEVRTGQTDLLNQRERGCRIPARIVGTIHHAVDAVIFDREFDSHAVWRNRVGIHLPDVGARRARKLGVLSVFVHAAGLIRQRAAGVRHHDLQAGMTLHETGEDQTRSRHADLNDAAKTELQRSPVAFQVFTKYGVGRMKEDRNAELFDSSVEGREPFSVDTQIGRASCRERV